MSKFKLSIFGTEQDVEISDEVLVGMVRANPAVMERLAPPPPAAPTAPATPAAPDAPATPATPATPAAWAPTDKERSDLAATIQRAVEARKITFADVASTAVKGLTSKEGYDAVIAQLAPTATTATVTTGTPGSTTPQGGPAGAPSFRASEIGKWSPEEYRENRDAVIQAHAAGNIIS